jgi:electron transfer flavoprotein alpha subunit
VAYEALGEAGRLKDALGGSVVAVVLGSGVKEKAASLGAYGADKVLAGDSELLARYNSDAYAKTLANAVKNVGPTLVLLSASSLGRDLAPNLAGALKAPMASDCTALKIEDGKVHAVRPVYAGKSITTVVFDKTPAIVTLRPKVFQAAEPAEGKTAEVEDLPVTVSAGDLKSVVREVVKAAGRKVDLTEADIIISGGRGMKGPENYNVIESLAETLGGAVGASRAAVDAGWRPHDDQVGQTGKTVSPQLYIACGISGAIQHLAGMSSSKCIVAINKDEDAPIFQVADYGIVGDLFEVVPVLNEELQKVVEK